MVRDINIILFRLYNSKVALKCLIRQLISDLFFLIVRPRVPQLLKVKLYLDFNPYFRRA